MTEVLRHPGIVKDCEVSSLAKSPRWKIASRRYLVWIRNEAAERAWDAVAVPSKQCTSPGELSVRARPLDWGQWVICYKTGVWRSHKTPHWINSWSTITAHLSYHPCELSCLFSCIADRDYICRRYVSFINYWKLVIWWSIAEMSVPVMHCLPNALKHSQRTCI